MWRRRLFSLKRCRVSTSRGNVEYTLCLWPTGQRVDVARYQAYHADKMLELDSLESGTVRGCAHDTELWASQKVIPESVHTHLNLVDGEQNIHRAASELSCTLLLTSGSTKDSI